MSRIREGEDASYEGCICEKRREAGDTFEGERGKKEKQERWGMGKRMVQC